MVSVEQFYGQLLSKLFARRFGDSLAKSVIYLDDDLSAYFTGHRTKRNWINNDHSAVAAFSTHTTTVTGEDLAKVYAVNSTTKATGDYTIGGEKNIYQDYSVKVGGDLSIAAESSCSADVTRVHADGSITIGEKAQVNGATKAHVESKQNITTHETSSVTGDDAKVLAGGNANIQGNVIGESTTNVQADNNLSTGEKSQIIAPKVNLRAANDAVVAGIVNSGQKTTQESDGESTSKEISNVTVLAGNDARISGTISGFDNNQLETKRDMTLLPQGKILDGDVDLAAYNNLSIYGMAAADGTLSVKAKGDEDKTELILGEKSALSGNSVEVGSISDGNIQARGTIVGVEEVCVHTDSNARLTLGEKFNARAKKVFIKAGIYSGDASTVISGTIEGSEIDAHLRA